MKFKAILTAAFQRHTVDQPVADTNMKVENALPRLFEWVEIPAGKVTLVEGGYLEESTTFDVPTFTIAKYPVTNMQFSYFVASGGYHQQSWWTEAGWQECKQHNWPWPRYWGDEQWNGALHPVVGVSWYEAEAFCNWQSEVSGSRITLPTEQQWQRAAQGDDGRVYPWGDDFDKSKCNTEESGIERTTPVTKYPRGASSYGVWDMSGNAAEWCLTLLLTGSDDLNETDARIKRGGACVLDQSYAICAYRDSFMPYTRSFGCGFRVVAAPISETLTSQSSHL